MLTPPTSPVKSETTIAPLGNSDTSSKTAPTLSRQPVPAVPKPSGPLDLDASYDAWRQDPSKRNMSAVLSAAGPVIRKAVYRHTRSSDPVAVGRAKSLVAKSLPRYDPSKASLGTFIDRQVQPLIRWQASRSNVARTTDTIRSDIAQLARAESEYTSEYGRAPSTQQLSDYSGLPPDKIAKIRRSMQSFNTGTQAIGEESSELSDSYSDLGSYNDEAADKAWLDIVRSDMSDIDKYILEHTLGLGGVKQLSNQQIAKNLKLSPGAISQRKQRIQNLLDRQSELNPFQ